MRRLVPASLFAFGFIVAVANAQRPPNDASATAQENFARARANAENPETQARTLEQQRIALSQPFRGLTTDGHLVPGLFHLRHTGVSTAPVRRAADAFLKGLTEAERQKVVFAVDDVEWRRWDNVPSPPSPPRFGVSLQELTEPQRQLALDLLRSSLSARGLKLTQDIMKLNATLAEMSKDDRFGRWLYSITIMGTPSATEPWGWQLDGHHLVINYFVIGDQVVMTPTFMGAEPVRAIAGSFAGTVVLQNEQDKGQRLFASLSNEQQAKATVSGIKGRSNTLAAAYQDNLVLDYAGIRATEMDPRQRQDLVELLQEYVGNLPSGQARIRMEELSRHLDHTYFAWIGSSDPGGVFYYRIQSPVILVEFDHQSAAGSQAGASRDHIHTIVRTPNGNDYGKDLLRQHYAQHPHTTQ